MLNYAIKAGTVDVSVVIRIIDSADGTPETGVVWNTAGIDLQYRRELEASTAITEATLAALTTAHTDGGFLHIGNGYYRLDLPDAACATGKTGVLIHGIVTGMVVIGCYIQLVAYDPFDAVGLGLSRVDAAISTRSSHSAVDVWASATRALTDKAGFSLSAAGVQAVWDALTSALTTAGSIGKLLVDNINATISSRASQTSVDTIDDFLDTEVAAIKAKTDQLTFTTANQVDAQAVSVAAAAIQAIWDRATSALSTVGSVGKLIVDNLNATISSRASQASLDTVDDLLDTEIAAIITDITTLLSRLSAARAGYLDNLSAGAVALQASVDDLEGRLTAARALLLDNLDATVSSRATPGQVNTEVLDVLNVDTFVQPGQEAPAATTTFSLMLRYLYKAWRNRHTQTTSEYALYADDGSTKDQEAAVSDDGTTLIRAEVTTGA